MNNRMPKILTSSTKNAREVVNPFTIHWVLLHLERARQSLFSQAVEAKNMADFWRIITPFDAISRHLTPYLWLRLKVVTASQAQFWARGSFHTPLDDMLIFFAVNFFCQWEWFWWIFWDFYDLFKDVQVIHYILGLWHERKINKVLKMSTIARFLMRNTSLDYLKFCI